jgi:hypothetical protein
MAIWWVSRSESLEREVRIFCLSSTIARWEEMEEDLVVWFVGFVGFVLDLGSWEDIVFCFVCLFWEWILF